MCSDGSGFKFWVHKGSSSKVMFYLEGGGACFSPDSCKPGANTYKVTVGHDDNLAGLNTGIWDWNNPANPFRDWSVVWVPYCTADVHIGNTANDYGNGVTIQHKGYVNATTALKKMAELFPVAEQVVVTGESAGSVPDPLYAGMTHDLLPNAHITVLADGSGAYPDIPGINAVVGGVWGTMNAVPAWPENAGMTAEKWSFPGLFVQAYKHDPSIVFARHDYAFDKTQAFFSSLAGIDASHEVELIDKNETEIEASGAKLASFITAGDSHTVLSKPDFYTETTNGVKFVDWVTQLITTGTVDDVHCTKCTVG